MFVKIFNENDYKYKIIYIYIYLNNYIKNNTLKIEFDLNIF